MNCPHCGHDKSSVTETRVDDGKTWRRRRCLGCLRSFVSQEITSLEMKMPRAVIEASLERLRSSPNRRRPSPTNVPPALITSGFKGWGTGATQ